MTIICTYVGGEKRKPSEPLSHEDCKRPRVVGDISVELINEVMSTITDPTAMLGPEVNTESVSDVFSVWHMAVVILKVFNCISFSQTSLLSAHSARDEAARLEERRGVIEFHVIGNSSTKSPIRRFSCGLLACRMSSHISCPACLKNTSHASYLTRMLVTIISVLMY